MKIICLKEWARLQHYKDRNPPWVKLYRDLLTSESWVLGTDTSRLVQVASMLLAARYGNEIPYRWDLLRKVASLECTQKQFDEAVRYLCANNFLEVQQLPGDEDGLAQPASTALATCNTEERRGEGETEERRDRGEGARKRALAVPGLDLKAWEEWQGYRAERKPAIKLASLVAAAEELAAFGDQQAVVVKHSKANGYQGLFAPKTTGLNGKHPEDTGWRPPEARR